MGSFFVPARQVRGGVVADKIVPKSRDAISGVAYAKMPPLDYASSRQGGLRVCITILKV